MLDDFVFKPCYIEQIPNKIKYVAQLHFHSSLAYVIDRDFNCLKCSAAHRSARHKNKKKYLNNQANIPYTTQIFSLSALLEAPQLHCVCQCFSSNCMALRVQFENSISKH